jgi:glycosyltransferase 2 family protein
MPPQTHVKQLAIGLTLAAFAIYFTLKDIQLDELWNSFGEIRYWHLPASTLLTAGVFLFRILRWKVLLSPVKTVKASKLVSPMMIGQLGNMLPLRAGEILRAYLLKKKLDIGFGSSLATIMIERMFDVFMLLILLASMLVFYTEVFNLNISWLENSLENIAFSFGIFAFGILIGLATFVYLLVFQKDRLLPLLDTLLKFLPEKWENKIQHLINSFASGLNCVRDPKNLARAGFYSIVEWMFVVSSYYPLCLAFNVENNSIESLLLLTVIIPVFMTALPTPGFLGSIQAAIYVALHEILGEDAVVAAAFGMVAWAWGLFTQVIAGLYFILHDHFTVRQIIELEKEGETNLREL